MNHPVFILTILTILTFAFQVAESQVKVFHRSHVVQGEERPNQPLARRSNSPEQPLLPTFFLYIDGGTGTPATPHKIYYPMIGICVASQAGQSDDYKSLTTVKEPLTNAPCKDDDVMAGELLLPVTASANGYLYAALEASGGAEFQVIPLGKGTGGALAETVVVNAGEEPWIRIDIGDACATLSCDLPATNAATYARSLLLFSWVDDETYHLGDRLSAGDTAFGEGVVYRVEIARKLPSRSPGQVPSFELFKGDARAFVAYDTERLTMAAREIRALRIGILGDSKAGPFYYFDLPDQSSVRQMALDDLLEKGEEPEQGEVILSDLENGRLYHLSICIENKWGFCSEFPTTQSVEPQLLAEFLREQGCFFFSAGFGREHPVIERLKWFRDHVLRKLPGGEGIVQFYYRVAPPYAHYVSQSPMLRAVVRSLGYLLSFIITYGGAFATLLILGAIWWCWRWRPLKNLLG